MENELQRLIAEQAKDMQRGNRVDREAGTVSITTMEPFLSNEGLRPMPRRLQRIPECAYHGRQDMRRYAGMWGARCAVCEKEYKRGWTRRNAPKLRERTKAWKEAHKDHVRAYNREYKRRKYWEAKANAALPEL